MKTIILFFNFYFFKKKIIPTIFINRIIDCIFRAKNIFMNDFSVRLLSKTVLNDKECSFLCLEIFRNDAIIE